MATKLFGKQSRRNKRKYAPLKTLINNPSVPFQYQESFHFLRTNIKFLSADKVVRKIVVTSSIPSEGKSSTSINLALSLSAAGHTVLLIDADLRQPALHQYMNISNGITLGLTNILHGMNDADECIQNYTKKLFVIPCGVIPPNPTEILGSKRMGELIAKMGEKFDYVILDTAPVSIVTDAAVLSQFADGVLLVVRQKMVTFDQARRAKRNLETVNANILGVVLNDFNMKHLDKESGYYRYYYKYGRNG